jgi:hypothetical protein
MYLRQLDLQQNGNFRLVELLESLQAFMNVDAWTHYHMRADVTDEITTDWRDVQILAVTLMPEYSIVSYLSFFLQRACIL